MNIYIPNQKSIKIKEKYLKANGLRVPPTTEEPARLPPPTPAHQADNENPMINLRSRPSRHQTQGQRARQPPGRRKNLQSIIKDV